MLTRKAVLITLLAGMLVLPVSALFGQTSVGGVNGTVTDPSGGAVPDASVKLTNQSTRIEDQTKTNATGFFVFINVKPGSYTLKVEAQNFKTVQVAPFDVGVNQTVTHTVALQMGTASTTVEVTAEAPQLDRSTTELGTVIQERVVSDLPLNGRNFTQLLTLTPGVTPVSTSQNATAGCCEGNVAIPNTGFSDVSFHGQQNRSKLYFYDGIINTSIGAPAYVVIPNIDLIQEFKVVGHDAKAEFGGATGGVVNMVSKSGTNNWHGSAFEFVRNDAFDARNAITEKDKSSPAKFRQNQFGAEAGGPIIKDKTFISGGYDGWRYSKPSLDLSYVPTTTELSGNLENLPILPGTSRRQIYNPYEPTGAPLLQRAFRCNGSTPVGLQAGTKIQNPGGTPCNILPDTIIDKNMQGFLLKYAATPNNLVATDPMHNFIQNRATTNKSNSFQVRVDHRFRESDNVFFRYTEHRVTAFNPIGDQAFSQGDSQGRNYGGGWVHTFRPNLILDVRAGYAGRPGHEAEITAPPGVGTKPMSDLGFKDIDKYGGMLVNLSSQSNRWKNGGNNNFGSRGEGIRNNPGWSITPNVSWIKGNHNIKTGFWFINGKRDQRNTVQTYNFTDNQTANPASLGNTGLSLASALLGLPGTEGSNKSFSGQLPTAAGGEVKFHYADYAAYVQDEWKMRPNVTLTAGLRFDGVTQPMTSDGRLWNALDIPNKQWIIGATTMPPLCGVAKQAPCIPDGTAPYLASQDFRQDPNFSNVVLAGKPFFQPRAVYDNWAPRVGVAWQVRPNTVLRGGYGLYWDSVTARRQYAQNDLEMATWPNAVAFGGTVNVPGTSAAQLQTIEMVQAGGFPAPLPEATPWQPTGWGQDPQYKDGYSQQWNIEVQRQMTQNLMISAAYVGSKSGRLPYSGYANAAQQPSPAGTPAATVNALKSMPWMNSQVNYAKSIGYADYDALEAKVQRRFTNGLSSLVSYTWSKSTDVSSGYFGSSENGLGGSGVVQNYFDPASNHGVSSYDITHFLSWAMVAELPAGKGKRWLQSGPASWILGNWQFNSILQARTGQPYTVTANNDIANIGGTGGVPNYGRPNIVGDPFTAGPVAANPGCTAPAVIGTSDNWFNPCAFTVPSASFGNLGRTPFRGPGVFNMDASLFKNVPLPREGMSLQLRVESFNTFNVQNWNAPRGTSINPASRQITDLAQGTGPREIQFGLRFIF